MDTFVSDMLFYVFGLLAVITAIMVIVKRNPVTSAIFMALSFASTAAILFILGAHFLGVVQIMVYTGAIMVLIVFIVMMMNIKETETAYRRPLPIILGVLVALGFVSQLSGVVSSIPGASSGKCCPLSTFGNAWDDIFTLQPGKLTSVPETQGAIKINSFLTLAEQTHLLKEPGRITDVNMKTVKSEKDGKDIVAIQAEREPIVIKKDGKAFVALERINAATDGEAARIQRKITIMNTDGDIVSALVENTTSTPDDVRMLTAGSTPANKKMAVQKQHAPKVHLPDIAPALAAGEFPQDSRIRKLIEQGEFPDAALLGNTLFTKYNIAFMIAGLSLLVATIGVVSLSRKPSSRQ